MYIVYTLGIYNIHSIYIIHTIYKIGVHTIHEIYVLNDYLFAIYLGIIMNA